MGALVTRFAVLFTAGGPAGEFTEMPEKVKQKLEEIRKRKLDLPRELKVSGTFSKSAESFNARDWTSPPPADKY